MKITIKTSCIGMNGEHLEQGITVDYPEAEAALLIRLGRASSDDGAGTTEDGDDTPSAEAVALLELTKDALLELAAKEEVKVKASATKPAIVEAILLKRVPAV